VKQQGTHSDQRVKLLLLVLLFHAQARHNSCHLN